MPLSLINPFADFIERVRSLKSNPKTYRTYSFSPRQSRKVSIEVPGNRIYFLSLPVPVRIRFNEPENDAVPVPNRFGIHQDFYRVYLEWDAVPTDTPIQFVAGFDFEMNELENRDVITDLFYRDAPLLADSVPLGTYDVSGATLLMLDWSTDCNSTINIYTSFDGVDFYGLKVVGTGTSPAFVTKSIESRFIKIEAVKVVPASACTFFKLSARVK